MSASTDVGAEVDAPEALTCETVAIKQDIACVAVVGVVATVRRVPLEDNLITSIAIYIADAGIASRVGVGTSVGSMSTLWKVEGQPD